MTIEILSTFCFNTFHIGTGPMRAQPCVRQPVAGAEQVAEGGAGGEEQPAEGIPLHHSEM